MSDKKKGNNATSFALNFLVAGTLASISKTTIAPLERLSLLFLFQDEMIKAGRQSHPYSGISDCVSRVIKDEGLGSFWRGNLTNSLRYFRNQGLNFAFRDYFKNLLNFKEKETNGVIVNWFIGNLVIGGVSGIPSFILTSYIDHSRARVLHLKTEKFSKGLALPCFSTFFYYSIYFGMYDSLKPFLPQNLKDNFITIFSLGWITTISATLSSYPLSNYIQQKNTYERSLKYNEKAKLMKRNSSFQTFKIIVSNEGWHSLLRLPSTAFLTSTMLLRSFASAGILIGYDQIQFQIQM